MMSLELSLTQLEKLLDSKRHLLDQLQKKRERLQKQLEEVDARILSVEGAGALTRRMKRGRKRPKNDRTLLDVVLQVLGEHKRGLGLSEIAQKVLETGYKTGAVKFENTVYQCLYNNSDRIFHDPTARNYRLK